MSGWLNAYDFAALLNPYLLARSAADVTDEATLADVPFAKAHLKTYRGDRLAEVRCRVGHVQYCADPHCKGAATEDVGELRPVGLAVRALKEENGFHNAMSIP